MKITQETFTLNTHRRSELLDINGSVEEIISRSGISDGVVTIYCPHTTAAITINENADPSVPHDILLTLDELFPQHRPGYRHSEGNSDAHCKSSLIGCSEQVLLKDGRLQLGTWQAIYFCEFDGPRSRKVIVQVSGQ
jgi:secondary thiamine-phosphate synthase enzyme